MQKSTSSPISLSDGTPDVYVDVELQDTGKIHPSSGTPVNQPAGQRLSNYGTSREQLIVFSSSSSRRKYQLFIVLMGCLVAIAVVFGLVFGLSSRPSPASTKTASPVLEEFEVRMSHRHAVHGKAAISSDAQACSDVARSILMKNGSAVDAAIAAQVCLGLFVPHSMGIGGGFFMIIYQKNIRKAVVIDARESAPGNATADMFHGNKSLSQRGPLSVAVLGELRGMEEAYKIGGRLPWAQLLIPSIQLCRKGIRVEMALSKVLEDRRDLIFADPGLSSVFVNPATGDVFKLNDFYKNPKLADTLEMVSKGGVEALYTGKLGKGIVQELQQMGGILTTEDLANYSAIVKSPVEITLKGGLHLFSVPPPGSGAILTNIMQVLDGYNITAHDVLKTESDTLVHHRIIEAFKFAYAQRTKLGDPQYVNMTKLVHNLTSPEYAQAIRDQIWDNRTFGPSHYEPHYIAPINDHGTSHLSVLSPDGDAVTVTSTINLYFGSGILSPSTGIILNDEMDDFASPNITNFFGILPSSAQLIVPGKRPTSSMCPMIVTDETTGDVILVSGAAGGTMITTATAYSTIRHLWMNETLTQSVEARRLHHQLYPNYISYEQEFSKAVLDGLEAKGHVIRLNINSTAVVNAISRSNQGLEACADSRKGGGVSGF